MIISINSSQTVDNDIEINDEKGFPIAYVGRGSYSGGAIKLFTYHEATASEEVHLIYIGRYSSLGANISIYCDMNHDYNSIYMGVITDFAVEAEKGVNFRERIGQVYRRMPRRGMIVIGNDVWIGNDVTIISDVVIGNGAVIGTGSVVTHDIPPYTIYAGNPARYISDRFPQNIVTGLQQISWWDYSREKLKEIENDMKGEVNAFVNKYEVLSKNCHIEKREDIFGIKREKIIVTFLDTATEYPAFCEVMEQFCEFRQNDFALFLCCYKENMYEYEIIDTLKDFILRIGNRADIHLLEIEKDDDETVISNSDGLILGRDIRNISRISHAFKYGINILSGVNKPIFCKM